MLLSDHATRPFSVATLSAARLDAAQLAYLSACSTAVSRAGELIDEAIHLTSAFQLAGFPQVVGTLWAVRDRDARRVAEAFYRGLRAADGELDLGRSAEVMHGIVTRLRDQAPESPSRWAAYLHVGAGAG